jgi:folylpolyglutamate synthase/dihydropteroate synthase
MPLVKFTSAVYAVPVPSETFVPPARIAGWAEDSGLPAAEYATADAGFAAALDNAGHDATVVVCGSLYLVAELRHKFKG